MYTKDIFLEMFGCFSDSKEYSNCGNRPPLDLDWIESQISFDDFLHLESQIIDYTKLYEKEMFQSGFIYAWELFTQCKEESLALNAKK